MKQMPEVNLAVVLDLFIDAVKSKNAADISSNVNNAISGIGLGTVGIINGISQGIANLFH